MMRYFLIPQLTLGLIDVAQQCPQSPNLQQNILPVHFSLFVPHLCFPAPHILVQWYLREVVKVVHMHLDDVRQLRLLRPLIHAFYGTTQQV